MEVWEYRNPEQFQALVRALMLAEFGAARYQVVDDSGGDGGLDGFDRVEGILHAIFCPEKPEKLTPARFAAKYTGDLAKAVRLRDELGYGIRVFALVTPHTLREPDQRAVRDAAIAAGFEGGVCISGEALAVVLERHRYLIERFPELALPRLEPQLDAIRREMERLTAAGGKARPEDGMEGPADPRGQAYDPHLFMGIVSAPELEEIEDALERGDHTALERLAIVRAQVSDYRLLVVAALIEQGYHWHRHDAERGIAVCEQGIRLAERLGMTAEEATLRAMLARFLALQAAKLDLERVATLAASQRVGMPLYDPVSMRQTLSRLRALSTRMAREINRALGMVQGGGVYNVTASYWVYSTVATIEAQMMAARQFLANTGHGERELAAARARVLGAQEAAVRMASLLGTAMQIQALENAANDLLLAGEYRIGRTFAERAVSLGAAHGLPSARGALLVQRFVAARADSPG
jgi:hypothetical protein